jgi:hypothetical protein
MVSNVRLAQLHLRLEEIFFTGKLYAGKNILLFGDLLQVFINIMRFDLEYIYFFF